jgi:hypothetical protein
MPGGDVAGLPPAVFGPFREEFCSEKGQRKPCDVTTEDFRREEVTEQAMGVLFGNGYRLTPPGEREETFTAKCFSSAKQHGVALVRTRDMFAPARYLQTQPDEDYARRCREAIFAAKGKVVEFPTPPAEDSTEVKIEATNGAVQKVG